MATEFTQQQGFGRGRGRAFDREPREYVPSESRGRARRPSAASPDPQRLARGLGWFSIGLGIAALAAPRDLGNATGVGNRTGTLRGVGVRELAAGVGILGQRNPAPWLWSRVIGDLMDLALLSAGLRSGNPGRGKAAASLAMVAGITALDVYTAVQFTDRRRLPLPVSLGGQTDVYVEKSMAVNKSPAECYQFWRNVENLPRFMEHLESVQVTGERRSHWVAKGPRGMRLEWDVEITDDRPAEAIGWRTLEGSQVASAGAVHFEPAPARRGTIVRLSMHYSPVGGRLTMALAKLLGEDPQLQIKDDLRRFKQLLETGEIPTTRGQPRGRRSKLARLTREGRYT
jgi:uncharacterized membrane protein